MTATREPAVAGRFYPRQPERLRSAVRSCVWPSDAAPAAAAPVQSPRRIKAAIVPHAGLAYSGPIAGAAYRHLAPLHRRVRRVVLVGPAHFEPIAGLAAPSHDVWSTPLGAVAIDRMAIDALTDLPQVGIDDRPHDGEHCLEVQLPFLLEVLGPIRVVPLLVGEAPADAVGAVLERLWDGAETIVVVSTDLSHFHDPATANRLDAETAAAIQRLDPEGVDGLHACGWRAVRGLLWTARRMGLRPVLLDRRTSADTAGGSASVVGYGAFVFEEPSAAAPASLRSSISQA